MLSASRLAIGRVGGQHESARTVQNGDNDPIDKNETSEDVCLGPPLDAGVRQSSVRQGPGRESAEQTHWRDERAARIRDHGPIKGEDAHAQAVVVPEKRVDHPVLGADPAHPGEDGEGGEKVAGEEVPEEGAEKRDEEEAFAGHVALLGPAICRVERVEQRGVDERGGPNHRARPDEEAAADAREGEADHLGRDDKEELVGRAPPLEVEGALGRDDVRGICATRDDIGHDRDQAVLLHVERPWVE